MLYLPFKVYSLIYRAVVSTGGIFQISKFLCNFLFLLDYHLINFRKVVNPDRRASGKSNRALELNQISTQNLNITIIHGNINFIGELSSRAYFRYNFIFIKNLTVTTTFQDEIEP